MFLCDLCTADVEDRSRGFSCGKFFSCSMAGCRVGEASRTTFALANWRDPGRHKRKSGAGRFAYIPAFADTPTRRYADTYLSWLRLRHAVIFCDQSLVSEDKLQIFRACSGTTHQAFLSVGTHVGY
jgi:hypothetical protein